MKLSEKYPNFKRAVNEVIQGKGASMVSDDSRKLAYQVPLANFKTAYDFYELNPAKDGRVFFTIVTMKGLRTICETNSMYFSKDMTSMDWQKLIYDCAFKHFAKEEYQALKLGYVKVKSSKPTLQPKVAEDKNYEPFNKDLEYLKSKPKEEWNNFDKFMKSSDEMLKLTLEVTSENNKKGCLMTLISLIMTSGFLISFILLLVKTF
ncbi:MAG: hypothetical protein HRU50_00050 [Winogradskyella sp.]|uniref:hypothetical protein n=1 Tax=Winogradskyella sp. TaxID=1883156 RepID=UPI0025F94537|nr:hypothetical protein [Winogradskyella sp.]NRB58312.1 hypothetical protein [Winogradskyella sp.]